MDDANLAAAAFLAAITAAADDDDLGRTGRPSSHSGMGVGVFTGFLVLDFEPDFPPFSPDICFSTSVACVCISFAADICAALFIKSISDIGAEEPRNVLLLLMTLE
jgi:hypothetical protein